MERGARRLEDGFEELEDRIEVESMLSRLRPREQAIVFLRFYRSMTQVEIADELGLSQVHVSAAAARRPRPVALGATPGCGAAA